MLLAIFPSVYLAFFFQTALPEAASIDPPTAFCHRSSGAYLSDRSVDSAKEAEGTL